VDLRAMDTLHGFMSFIINFGNKQTDHRMEVAFIQYLIICLQI